MAQQQNQLEASTMNISDPSRNVDYSKDDSVPPPQNFTYPTNVPSRVEYFAEEDSSQYFAEYEVPPALITEDYILPDLIIGKSGSTASCRLSSLQPLPEAGNWPYSQSAGSNSANAPVLKHAFSASPEPESPQCEKPNENGSIPRTVQEEVVTSAGVRHATAAGDLVGLGSHSEQASNSGMWRASQDLLDLLLQEWTVLER